VENAVFDSGDKIVDLERGQLEFSIHGTGINQNWHFSGTQRGR